MSPHSSDNLWENIKVARPCRVAWDEMEGSERARVCGECLNYVFNIADVPNSEAESLIQDSCGVKASTAFRRADGKLMIADCPKKRSVFRSKVAVSIGILALAGALTLAGVFGLRAHRAPLIKHDHDYCMNCDGAEERESEPAPSFHRVVAAKTLPVGHKIKVGDVRLGGEDPPGDDSFYEADTSQLIDLVTTRKIPAGTTIKAHQVKRSLF